MRAYEVLKRSTRSTLQGERPVSKSPFERIPVSMGVGSHVVLGLGAELVVGEMMEVDVTVLDAEVVAEVKVEADEEEDGRVVVSVADVGMDCV